MKKILPKLESRCKTLTLYSFVDRDTNQILYSCLTDNLDWAEKLFENQFQDTPDAGSAGRDIRVYQAPCPQVEEV